MAGVYISWPFCAQKCTYCNFASGVFPRELEQQYLDALTREIRSTIWQWTPQTIYLGGGTPASMDPDALDGLLRLIPGASWAEATIEAAPGAITRQQAQAWLRSGLNRVSLGVQSFVETELRRTGRKHTAANVAEDVAMLRSEGFSEINIDLIAGLPGQTTRGWASSLDHVESLDVPHVSVYMLEVDEDSRLGKELLLGGVRYGAMDVPGEQQIVECYEQAVDRLAEMGLQRYEISNFARPDAESLHNLKYWQLEPYLGFGADAHSFDGRLRWQNVETPAEYVKAPDPRLSSVKAVIAEERFFVGLRLMKGIQPTPNEWAEHRGVIDQFVTDGLLATDGQTLRLTPRGILLSNEVFEEFIHA